MNQSEANTKGKDFINLENALVFVIDYFVRIIRPNQRVSEKKKHTHELICLGHFRILWIVVHIIGAVSIITILDRTLEHHMTNPFVTTLYDMAYPISQIGFPGKCITYIEHYNESNQQREREKKKK